MAGAGRDPECLSESYDVFWLCHGQEKEIAGIPGDR